MGKSSKKKPVYRTDFLDNTNKDILKVSCPPWLMDKMVEDSLKTLRQLGLSK